MIDNNLGPTNYGRGPFCHYYTLSGHLMCSEHINLCNFTGIKIFWNGNKEWWVDGKYHREDGPAIINNIHLTWATHGVEIFKIKYIEGVTKESSGMIMNLMKLKGLI